MDIEKLLDDAANQFERDEYGLYLRKSRADLELEALGEGETLARHKKMLDALAEKNGIHPDQITVYKELVSGDSISERPEMQRLLSDVYKKKYKGVLVVEVERLARGNTRDQGEVADAFQYSDTLIITPAKTYDPNDEYDQEYFEFGLFMSRREYKTIKRRLKSGREESVKEGNYVPSVPPFGFDAVRKSKKERILVERPDESHIVKMIFDWRTEDGKAPGWIARELTKMNIPTRNKAKEWSRTTIRDILTNVHYIGMVSWNEQQTVKEHDPATGKLVKKRNKYGNEEIYKGKHDGFISKEQFDKAQAMFKKSAPVKIETIMTNPFAGILRCAGCEKIIGIQKYRNKSTGYRVDRFTHKRSTICTMKSLPVDLVVAAVIEALQAYIKDCEIKMESDHGQEERNRHEAMIQTMEAELVKQEKKKRRLFDSWEADDGTYTKEEFIERKQMYANTIEALKAQIKESKAAFPEPVDYKAQIVTLHALIDCINNPDLDAKEKNDFLKQYIEEIKYDVIDYGVNKGGKPVLTVFLK